MSARELLEYAALLHDVGHHIDHQNHHRHSYYLITNGELLGFQRDELEIIGLVARYHRKAAPKASDPEFRALPQKARQTVRVLSAILRIADACDRSHYGVVRDITVARRNGRLILQLDHQRRRRSSSSGKRASASACSKRSSGLTWSFELVHSWPLRCCPSPIRIPAS